jgi:hypothetical protein
MNRIDELLGVATVAAAAMFVAVAVAPVTRSAPVSDPASIVVLPSVDVVVRRSIESARIEHEEALDRQRLTKGVLRPEA